MRAAGACIWPPTPASTLPGCTATEYHTKIHLLCLRKTVEMTFCVVYCGTTPDPSPDSSEFRAPSDCGGTIEKNAEFFLTLHIHKHSSL